jgi:hypothetical protein
MQLALLDKRKRAVRPTPGLAAAGAAVRHADPLMAPTTSGKRVVNAVKGKQPEHDIS